METTAGQVPGYRTKFRLALAVAAVALLSAPLSAEVVKGDRDFGEYLSSLCVTCHQLSGKATGGIPPIIAWPEDQFIAVMEAYRSHQRENRVMQTIAARLSHEEVAALAAYLATLKPAR